MTPCHDPAARAPVALRRRARAVAAHLAACGLLALATPLAAQHTDAREPCAPTAILAPAEECAATSDVPESASGGGLEWIGTLEPGSRVALRGGHDAEGIDGPLARPAMTSMAQAPATPAVLGTDRARATRTDDAAPRARPAVRMDLAWLRAEEVRRTATGPEIALASMRVDPRATTARSPTVGPDRHADRRGTAPTARLRPPPARAPAAVVTPPDRRAEPDRAPLLSPWSTDAVVVYRVDEPLAPEDGWPGDIRLSQRARTGVVLGMRDLFADPEYRAGQEFFGPPRIQDSSAYLRFDRGF